MESDDEGLTSIPITPMSINKAFKGRRFKTPMYKKYSKALPLLLPKNYYIPKGKLEIVFHFYFKSKASDWDNCIKCAQDLICKKYGINDNRIYKGTVYKHVDHCVDPRIDFKISEFTGY